MEGPELLKTFLGEAGFQLFALGKGDIRLFLAGLVQVSLGTTAILFFLMMLYGGFLWLTAGGNDENISRARKILGHGVVGFIVTLSAMVITRFVADVVISAATAPATEFGIPVEPTGAGLKRWFE